MGKHNKSTQNKKEQKKDRAHGAAPISMTQEELDLLAAGGLKAQRQFARRLQAAAPSEGAPKVKSRKISDKASPARITRAEMAETKRSGRVRPTLLKRFER